MLSFILMTATMVAVYWFWIRPILKSRPAFAECYACEESVFAALREKLKGIKQKLSSAIVIAASAAVSGYDFITPIVGGVDVSSIAAQVPSWASSSPASQRSFSSCAILPTPGTRKSWPTRPPARRRTTRVTPCRCGATATPLSAGTDRHWTGFAPSPSWRRAWPALRSVACPLEATSIRE